VPYDAIIVGASFAGLAAASRLKGRRVLLLDRKEIGTMPTSACGVPLRVVRDVGCEDAVTQVHPTGYVYTPKRSFEYRLPEPYCVVDYERFCRLLFKKGGAEFVRAPALGVSADGHTVTTAAGAFQAECVVDASGWRAALAKSLDKGFVDTRTLAFGVETEATGRGDGLHFWFDPNYIYGGYAWNFPSDGHCRVGVGYFGENVGLVKIRGGLTRLLDALRLEPGHMHGGYIPFSLRRGVVGNVFVVGDAAGQSLPTTGEGIRPAIYFGLRCGDMVRDVVERRASREATLRTYAALVEGYRSRYDFLQRAQGVVMRLPTVWMTLALAITRVDWLRGLWLPRYTRAFQTGALAGR